MNTELLEPVIRITKDIKNAARTLSDAEARFLVDAYYQMQSDRIRSDARCRELMKEGEPNDVMQWLGAQSSILEKSVANALDAYSSSHPMGQWMRSICGIGPVISAGILANIDIEKAPTAGHLWSYAGLLPDSRKVRGEKLAYNAGLKTLLVFKLGECFVKVQNNENDIYGKIYAERKAWESKKNENGEYAEYAKQMLERKSYAKTTEAYKALSQGKLPLAQIHARARRYAVKMFVSHLQEVWYFQHYGVLPPAPYVFVHLGHAHYICPPNTHLIEGFDGAKKSRKCQLNHHEQTSH